MDTIPESEWNLYFDTIEEAISCARLDCAGLGFRILDDARQRLEEMEDDSEEWTLELGRKYRNALDRYAERYGEKFIL